MQRKIFMTAIAYLASAVMGSSFFVPISNAAPSYASTSSRHKIVGITRQSIENAKKAGRPGQLVTITPQSNLRLLSRATELGPYDQTAVIHLTIALKLRNEAKLKNFLEQVQNPTSSDYRQWLTPAEFTRLYGPTKADVARTSTFLQAHGITVNSISPNRMLIHTTATTSAYEHAFGVMINSYKLGGRHFYSTMDSPKLPRSLAPLVVGILGLDHGAQMRPISLFQQPLASTRGLNPSQAPPPSLTDLSPLQIARAYNYPDITNPDNGRGVNVAILTAESPGLAGLSDPHDFWASYGLPNHTINVIPIDGDNGSAQGMGETLLDVEYSGAMGPGIIENVYVANDVLFSTFTDMYNRFVSDTNPNGTAKNQIMTTSWGRPETAVPSINITDNQIFEQAAAEGISMFAAAGDSGSGDGTGQDDVANFPSSSPYITAANGTQLSIESLAGDYGSEVVWNDANCFGNGPAATGGAISQLFDKPVWQAGPGVPTDVTKRMNSDMAATASCSKPMLTLQGGQWLASAGTSAVAPQFAGMFAIAVAENGGEPLGQSNELIYADANSHYASDFHDVTEGSNGAFQAGPNWDHPTGWGSPNVQNLLSHIGVQGPRGTFAGTVTDEASGKPIVGAIVTMKNNGQIYKAKTRDDGTYTRLLPVGSFNVKVTDFGYKSGVATVSISNGQTTTQNFSLTIAPTATLSGTVTDGSGHGYGLYAEIKASVIGVGLVATAWTNPATGRYSIQLPEGHDYELIVAAAFDGYNTASTTVTLSKNKNANFSLKVINACTAPGYAFSALGEDFNENNFPPNGWQVTNPVAGAVMWQPSSTESNHNENYTDGTGDAADADSGDSPQPFGEPFDTALVTPPIPVTSLHGAAVLRYKANAQLFGGDALDLDISEDGGTTWNTIEHWTTLHHGSLFSKPGVKVSVDLEPYLPSSGIFKLRWRYYNLNNGGQHWYAQIDDVVLGSCMPIPGGLITGQVTDANTGDGIVGARVENDKNVGTNTIVNPADANLLKGTYMFFSTGGDRVLTVSDNGYPAVTASIAVKNNKVIKKNFSLKAAQFEITKSALTARVMVNNTATVSLALKNTGSSRGQFHVFPIDAPPPPTGADAMPVRRVKTVHPVWMNKSFYWIRAHARPKGSNSLSTIVPALDALHSSLQTVSDYPIAIADNAASVDVETGKIYSIAGSNNENSTQAASYIYDPNVNAWSPIANIPAGREAPIAEFIGGKLYVTDGSAKSPLTIFPHAAAELDIYDPTTDTWNKGAPIPVAGYGAASVVLNGKLYVVGGISPGSGLAHPTKYLNLVQVYNPTTNTWQLAAPYPHPANFLACGTIEGKIYCAGGGGLGGALYADGYVYDPHTNQWSPIENMNIPGGVLGSVYAVANGELLMAGGFLDNGDVTNQVEAYDPITDNWSALPNLEEPVARAGGVCDGDSLYSIGGTLSITPPVFTSKVQKLQGYACSGIGISWLTVSPTTGTVNSGAQAIMTATFDGTGQKEFTTSKAYLRIGGNTPYGNLIVPLTVTWMPQPVDLELAGEANPNVVKKGGNLVYTLRVHNKKEENHGTASDTLLTYHVPEGAEYVTSGGDADCTAPPERTSSASSVESGEQPKVIVCSLGVIGQGASKTVTIAVRADKAGILASHFKVTAREPNNSGRSVLDLTTIVVGDADISTSAESTTLTAGSTGAFHLAVTNAGPDTATDVKLELDAGTNVRFQSVKSWQGHCSVAGTAIECDLGEIAVGKQTDVKVAVFGINVGSTQVTVQATTTADDTDLGNNVATAQVKVEAASTGGSNHGGGGGALDWLSLAALLGLALSAAGLKRLCGWA